MSVVCKSCHQNAKIPYKIRAEQWQVRGRPHPRSPSPKERGQAENRKLAKNHFFPTFDEKNAKITHPHSLLRIKTQPLNNQLITYKSAPNPPYNHIEGWAKAGRRQSEGWAKDKRYITEYQAFYYRTLTLHYSQQKPQNIAFSATLSPNHYSLTTKISLYFAKVSDQGCKEHF